MPFESLPIIYWVVFAGILGLIIGSFLNVVILRLPIMLFRQWLEDSRSLPESLPKHPALKDLDSPFNLSKPNSRCPECLAPVKAWQNIPVISFLLLKGRCAHCQVSIPMRYPVIEIITALVSILVILNFDLGLPLLGMLMFSWTLIALSLIDYDHQLLPDQLTLPLLWLGLIFNLNASFTTLESAVMGAIFGYLSLWSVYWAFKLTTGKEGMGYGDFKLLAALGAWLGHDYLLLIVLLSSLVGAGVGIYLVSSKKQDSQKPIPFGPYLACAGFISALWGEQIINIYWELAGL